MSGAPRRRNACLAVLEKLRRTCGEMSVSETVAFLYVCENEGINIRELAQLAGLSASSASRTARRLASPGARFALAPSFGLVELRLQPGDGRGRILYLTALGRALRDELDQIIAAGALIGATSVGVKRLS